MAVELDKLAGKDGGNEGQRLARFWHKQLDKIKDDPKFRRWNKRGNSIEKRYRDERNRTDEEGQRRCNVLWTNIEILTPALYGKCPLPVAQRKFHDKDPVGRGAAQILERGLRNEIEICGFDEAMQQAVRDYLLPGRGTVWVRYEPEVEESVSISQGGGLDIKDNQGNIEHPEEDDDEGETLEVAGEGEGEEPTEPEVTPEETKLIETGDRITRESTPIDYIHWEDFFTIPNNARVWKEVTAVGKRVYMTHGRMKARFGKDIAKDVPLKKDTRTTYKYEGAETDPDDKGEVYEIWSLSDKAVFWIANGYDHLMDRKDDPLKLENFYPCPKPLYSNATSSSLVPVPDYIEYQDQAIQIDELTQRISMLAKACKVAGVYNAAAKDIMRLLDESVENELIPVDDWAAFAEKGGVAGNISLLPLKEIIGCIEELQKIKQNTIVELDRLTGINDIMRGTTDARETLGGQRLKTNNTGTRLQRRQNEVARFARDTVRIMADIMSQHFSPTSLIEASGALYNEGLGAVDMPDLSTMQGGGQPPMQPQQAPFSGLPQAQGPATPPVGAGPNLFGGGGPPPMPMGGPPMPPQGGMGGNVVPFAPPGRPPMPMGGPMGMPGMMPMAPPPMDPALIAKMQGLKRISDAIDLIRNERLRGFRVDIEVDSTIFGDLEEEKNQRIQFVQMVTQYLQQSMMMAAQVPEIAPLLGKFLQFAVRGFHIGRDLEAAIEEFCENAVKMAKQKQMEAKQAPKPELISAQADMLKAKTAAQSTVAKDKREDTKLSLDSQDQQRQAANEQESHRAEIVRQQVENQGEQANIAGEMQQQQMENQAAADAQEHEKEMKSADMGMKAIEVQIAKIHEMVELYKLQSAQRKATADNMKLTEGSS